MTSETAKVLMKKGKRGAAAYIHADCAGGSGMHVGPLMDVLLNPSKAIDEWETIDWCRWLIAGGRTPDEYGTVVRSYDKHDKCGLVWIPRVVAYRCRTCGISPCMSICRECFHRGDHSTHDFNMFLSQAGGACDCGDNSVMKEDGFCSNHGNKCLQPGSVPSDLLCVAEAMMPRLILRLLQHFRENGGGPGQSNSETYRSAVQECEGYVQMLLEFNNMGDIMRSAMTKALINPQMYSNLVHPPFPKTDYGEYLVRSQAQYEQCIEAFPAPDPPDEYRHLPALAPKLQHHTLLDEFIFWTFKYEFPQNVVCFLLNMLPDQDYKEQLTRTFVLHYARIPLVLEAAADPDTLSNRVVHMSVQLFSNEALALRCVRQLHLLHVMVLSLRLMMSNILLPHTLHEARHNRHRVVDCTRRLMREHCYWPLVSDLNNVLSHRSVALVFLQDEALLELWLGFLGALQGMNVNVRETGDHIEFEPSSYYAAFSCELEAAAYPMWSVLAHAGPALAAAVAARVLAHLRRWLAAVGVARVPAAEPRASFHFPLHRYAAAFLCAANAPPDVLPPAAELALLAYHPLRTQSLFYEILAELWVRNGLQIKGQAMTYIQANFCNSMVDMDIYWLQVCAANLPADQFLEMCIDTFGVRSWVSLGGAGPVTPEQDAMLEGLLTFLGVIVGARTNLGLDELTQSRLEVAALLAANDRTHSQLLELMPERSGNAHTRNFEAVLRELSTYRPPPRGSENLEQGLFVPTAVVWEQYYEPLHVLRRAVHRRDFYASMDRFSAYVREKCKSEGTTPPAGPLWPPLRLSAAPPGGAPDPRAICSSGVLHGLILSVLHRGVHRRSSGAAPLAPPDHVLALSVLLLAQAAHLHAEHAATRSEEACVPLSELAPVSGLGVTAALRGGSVCAHARTLLRSVPAPPPRPEPAPAQVSRSDIEVDEQSDPEVDDSVTMRALEDSIPGDTGMALALPQVQDMPPDDALAVALPHYEMDEGESSEWSLSLRDAPTLLAPSSNQIQEEVSDEQSIPVNESIISLLLKLHSQLSGKADSYDPEDTSYVQPDRSTIIGDGPYFIGRVLHELCRQDPRCAEAVQGVRNALWPHRLERGAEETARELTEREDRSRRARERRQQVLAEFARRQTEFGRTLPELRLAAAEPCAICGGGGELALCVLIQSSALLAHRRPLRRPAPRLPLNEPRAPPCATHHNRLHAKLQTHYDQESWLQSVNLCWESGVHVQSCGHVLHANCLAAYQRTLSASQRPHNLLVERGEFLCPVCRQLANSVLPGRSARAEAADVVAPEESPEQAISRLLSCVRAPDAPEPCARIVEEMSSFGSAALRAQLARLAGSAGAAALAAAGSLVRTALECELLLREDQAPEQRYRLRHCLVPLMEVVGTHLQAQRAAGVLRPELCDVWRALTCAAPPPAPPAPGVLPRVPVLLRDPVALLIQIMLLAPENPPYLDLQHFRYAVRVLYALHYWQVVVQLLARAPPSGRAVLARLTPAARPALLALQGHTLLAEPDDHDEQDVAERLADLLRPFLRTAALLQELLYGDTSAQDVAGAETWAAGPAWVRALAAAGAGAEAARAQHEAWARPGLLLLPREYDLLFSHYHERVCPGCGAAPKEAAVCLVCGALLCLKAACCRRRDVCEAARHAERCGGGTAVLLAVTSTYTVVIRGRRACLWGSLYLDAYDEEDRDLKRGKPLYLSRDRFELLQAQWLAHRFDHTKRTWVWHRDSL